MTNLIQVQACPCNFSVSNVAVQDNYDGLGVSAVTATVTTELGSTEVLEWVGNGHVETQDSHISIQQADDLATIFNNAEKPSLMPNQDWVPVGEIHTALQEWIDSQS